jgi:hypothetical protein
MSFPPQMLAEGEFVPACALSLKSGTGCFVT